MVNAIAGLLVAVVALSISDVAQSAVGRTAGTASVSNTGSAEYEIALWTPGGTNGLTPTLSLKYSSQGGRSPFGVGWSLTGLSTISRCGTTWQDGPPRNVRNDALDKFCLDGNRLRLVSGTYGAAGAEYRTEVETFARVRSYGAAGAGPASFTVEMKDGLIYEYGNTTDSRILSVGQATARLWAVNKIRDRFGNAILFAYTVDAANGSYRIDSIQYTQNLSRGAAPRYEVKFSYDTLPTADVNTAYLANGLVKRITRASRIDVNHDGATLRRYVLVYESALSVTNTSRLSSIQECAGPTLDCLSPTTFTYQNGTAGWLGEINTGIALPEVYTPLSMDVNGDGRSDMVYPSSLVAGEGYWMVALATVAGSYGTPTSSGYLATGSSSAAVIDYNADGLDDLLVPYSGTSWWVLPGTASGFAAPIDTGSPVEAGFTRVWDVNGDGLEDLAWVGDGSGGGSSIKYRLREPTGTFASTPATLLTLPSPPGQTALFLPSVRSAVRAPDFDGDGRGDYGVYYWWTQGATTYSGYTFACSGGPCGVSLHLDSSLGIIGNQQFGDFNGDGLTDMLYVRLANMVVRFSTGTSATSEIVIGPRVMDPTVLDWDGDGRDDILYRNGSLETATWFWRRSTGESFAVAVDTGIALGNGPGLASPTISVDDVNGDGLLDLTYTKQGVRYIRLRAGKRADLLLSASDGFGVTATFDYIPITQGHYTKEGSTFPLQSYAEPLHVVRQLTQSTGVAAPATYSQEFWYYGGRMHLQGRGFQGFSKRRVIDSRTSLRSYEEFEQSFPLTGLRRGQAIYQSNDTTLVTDTDDTWQAISYGSGDATRKFPYLSRTETRQYEFGGAFNGQLVRTTRRDNSVDPATGTIYDTTVTSTEAATANGTQAGATYIVRDYRPTAAFYNDWSSWCFGRPQDIQVTRSHNQFGGSPITRATSITWDPVTCRVAQERIEPGHAQLQATRAFAYDAFGNLGSMAVTGVGMATRALTINWGADGRFPLTVANALSETSTLTWDPAIGELSGHTDANGEQTTWQFDVFGRRRQEQRPDGTSTTWSYNECTSVGCLSAQNKSVVIESRRDANSGIVSDSQVYADRFGRPIRINQKLLSGAYSQMDVEYDALGRKYRQSAPCWSASCTQHWTTHTYDDLNRVTLLQRPLSDSNPTLQSMTIHHEGLTTRSIDALSKQSTHVRNAAGAMVRSIDHDGYYQTFDYDGFGNVLRVTDSLNNTLQSMTYNVRGMRTASSDMSMGTWVYMPNALGEVTSQIDAKNQTTTFVYDLLGRLTSRTEAEGVSTFTFGDSAGAHNIGRLVSISGPGYTEAYAYDGAGRLLRNTITSDATYQIDYAYNTIGALDTLTYPTSTSGYRLKLQYEYEHGSLKRVRDFNIPATVFWVANETSPRSAVIDETLGNGIRTIRGFDAVTGLLDFIQSGPGGGSAHQDSSYVWDAVGNLLQRADSNLSQTRAYQYDNLHRLDSWTVNGSPGDLQYNALGNITFRNGLGAHTYHATKKHQLLQAGTNSFTYDNNGNAITRNGSPITWYSYNLPRLIAASSNNSSEFFYAPDRSRWKQVASYAGTSEQTIYIGGMVEKVTRGSVTSWRHYIAGGSGVVAEHIRRSSGTNETMYLLKDQLGSIETITNATGGVVARLAYGVLGPRRNGTTWSGTPTSAEWAAITNATRRGFTGHEMLDNLNLVHMNGRVYDNVVGRFISADPIVQAPTNTQSFNRYSYALNNPIRFTDPSGYNWDDPDHNWWWWWYGPGYNPNPNPYPPPPPGIPPRDDNDCASWNGNCGLTPDPNAPGPVPPPTTPPPPVQPPTPPPPVRPPSLPPPQWPGPRPTPAPVPSEWPPEARVGGLSTVSAESGSCVNGNSACDQTSVLSVDADWTKIANDWWPGYQLGTCIYQGCSGPMWIIGAIGVWPGGKGAGVVLSSTSKALLGVAAREIWAARMGRSAAEMGLEVHHRIPLEWSHLFPDLDPNRVDNLIGVPDVEHWRITAAWNDWRDSLNGRVPTREEIEGFARMIDDAFSDAMTRLP